MKSKLKARFLPPIYVQDYYSQFHHLTQGVEEFTREFEKLVIKCDLQEPEEQTIVGYLGGLDPRYANVVELHAYTSFDEVCVLAHKVEHQKKNKQALKHEFPKPPPHDQFVNKGSTLPTPKPTTPIPPIPQKDQTPQQSLPSSPRPKTIPMNIQRCFKCEGFGHLALDCTNHTIITLAEWQVAEEAKLEEESEENDGDNFKETLE